MNSDASFLPSSGESTAYIVVRNNLGRSLCVVVSVYNYATAGRKLNLLQSCMVFLS